MFTCYCCSLVYDEEFDIKKEVDHKIYCVNCYPTDLNSFVGIDDGGESKLNELIIRG